MAAKSSGSSEKTTRRAPRSTTTRTRRTRSAASAPADAPPAEGAPVESAAAEPTPVESEPVESEPVESEPVERETVERETVEREATRRETGGSERTDREPQAWDAAEVTDEDWGDEGWDEQRTAEVRGPDERGDERRGRQRRPAQGRQPEPWREARSEDGNGDAATGRRRRRRRRRGGRRDEAEPRGGQQARGRARPRQPQAAVQNGGEVIGVVEGILELHPKGYGFLRDPKRDYMAQETDVFVSSTLIEKAKLREGILIRGEIAQGTKGQGPRLKNIETVDGRSLEDYQKIRPFEDLTAVTPFEQIRLERGPQPVTMRVMDLLTPIAKGQRALIVAPPRSGKTMLMHDIADSVSHNHPEIHLMVLLIDERPEEVTEMRRRVRGEVIASSMDREVESHVRVSQLIFERAKRMAEAGGDVFILLDSITRTARAFNKWIGSSGKTGTGGLDVRAMDIPRKMFGTARRFDEGGSLTVVGTALIDTGSRMDDAIFQEFKGTGNMEMVLSRDLADRRIWPSIDISQSGTRREEKILDPEVLDGVTMLRRSLISLHPTEAMEQLIRTLDRFPSNAEFLAKIRSVL